MDKIIIEQLKVETIIGVLEWERKRKQPLIFDIELFCDIKHAALSEKLSDTIDYAQVANSITEFVSQSQFQLLETLAEKIVQLIFANFKIKKIKLTIRKPSAIANAAAAMLVVEREN